MNLTQILLEGTSRPSSARPAMNGTNHRRLPLPRRAPVVERTPGRSGLRRMLEESVTAGDVITLTISEQRAVLRLLDEADRDPFTYRAGQFDADDLSSVGLDAAQGGQEAPADGTQQPSEAPSGGTKLLDPSLAVTAPDSTPPSADAPPPPEIEGALQVFNDPVTPAPNMGAVPAGPVAAPAPEKDYDAMAAALIHGGGPDDEGGDDAIDRLVKRPSAVAPIPAMESAPAGPVVIGGAADVLASMKASRRKALQEKQERAKAGRAKKE